MTPETTSQATPQVLVARQPICGLNARTFAYELLFRSPGATRAVFSDPDLATAQVIVNSFMDIGLDRIVGAAPAFINVTQDFIVKNNCRSLPKDRVVFEILEDTVPDQQLFKALESLTEDGYHFALDDFAFGDRLRPLLKFCDYVKVDLRQINRDELAEQLRTLEGIKLLAEKVETHEEYEFCRQMGFHYFQGYYFCKPNIVTGSKIAANKLSVFRLMSKLRDPNVNPRELEKIVGEDISLSYKLLRYINSAFLSLRRNIESVGHAVRMVGTDQIRMLASLLMLTSLDDKPRELVTISLIRARMCELLAMRLDVKNPETFFTVGLFSTLDAFLDCPMNEALSKLPLSDEIKAALLNREGSLGDILKCVLEYEQASMDEPRQKKLDVGSVRNAYVESVSWGENLMTAMAA